MSSSPPDKVFGQSWRENCLMVEETLAEICCLVVPKILAGNSMWRQFGGPHSGFQVPEQCLCTSLLCGCYAGHLMAFPYIIACRRVMFSWSIQLFVLCHGLVLGMKWGPGHGPFELLISCECMNFVIFIVLVQT